jgi:KaiC/GvpD/RAD55 family RecA-like ATPase
VTDPDAILKDEAALVAECKAAGHGVLSPAKIKCSWHNDKNPSASIFLSREGHYLYHCHACNVTTDIFGVRARRTNVPRNEAYHAMTGTPTHTPVPPRVYPDLDELLHGLRNVEDRYRYIHPDTKAIELVIVRVNDGGSKRFLQITPVIGGWVMKGIATGPLPLLDRMGIAKADVITLVEGEKCAKALVMLGVQATCWPGGAEAVQRADLSPLAGKQVVVWPDHDKVGPDGHRKGHEVMRQAIAKMQALNPAPTISWIDPDDLGLDSDGSDVCDYLDDCDPRDKIERRRAYDLALTAAQPVDPLAELVKYQEDSISGRNRPAPFPLTYVHKLSRALVPETITLICGEPGGGKSLLLLQGVLRWAEQGIPTAVWMLEDQKHRHLSRVLAIASGEGNITHEEWMEKNPDLTRRYRDKHREVMERVSPCIHATDDGEVTYNGVLEWAESQAKAGKRIIAIDPITACEAKGDVWIEDRRLLMGMKRVARTYGCSIILVTHPNGGAKAQGGSLLDRLAGGKAFPRFAHTILWVAAEVPGEKVYQVKSDGGAQFEYSDINRLIHIAKCRNGVGSGAKVAARFEYEFGRFCFEEKGVVIGIKKHNVD